MQKRFNLSKSKILLYRQCPKRLWLQVNHPDLAEVDAGAEARMREGNVVGAIARDMYPGGWLIDTLDRYPALKMTQDGLAVGTYPIYEAAFCVDNVLVRADILLPREQGAVLIEVKSSTSVKEYYLDDISVQSWVMREAGCPPQLSVLMHINNAFVYPGYGQYRGLFTEVNVTQEVAARIDEVPRWIAEARRTLNQDTEPDDEPGEQCNDPFPCPFIRHCRPPEPDVAFPVEILPHGKKLAEQLRAEGYRDLRDVPEDKLTNPKHIRVHRVTKTGRAELDWEAVEAVRSLAYPRYYLDFETIAFAVPIWAGTSPYKQIPFQWSCHIEHDDGVITHDEFLDTTGNDPRRGFAESLIQALGSQGPIIVYNAPFEGSRMQELAAAFPDLAPQLLDAVDRLFDLLPLARKHYYHPDMKGSWSIKAVLPTIAPELDYSNLTVSHGGMAQDAYLDLIGNELSDGQKAELRKALFAYCEQDTLAMVKILKQWEM